MGQYYAVAIRDPKNKYSKFYDIQATNMFNSFLKLMESAWWKNPYVNAVFSLLKDEPLQVAWMGDYSKDCYEKTMPISKKEYNEAFAVTNGEKSKQDPLTDKDFVLTENMYSEFLENNANNIPYFVNLTKKEFVNLSTYYKRCLTKDGWCIHPLPLLTACGNGQEGGDYFGSEKELVGSWAFDTLVWLNELPEGDFKEIKPTFKED